MKVLTCLGLLVAGAWLCAARVEEPPRDPIDCMFCGGNPLEHARKLLILQVEVNQFTWRLLLR